MLTYPLDSKLEWAALFALGGGVCDVCSLRYTSGTTPADLLTASMAASCFSPHVKITTLFPKNLPAVFFYLNLKYKREQFS